jgi:hypothetical protein
MGSVWFFGGSVEVFWFQAYEIKIKLNRIFFLNIPIGLIGFFMI